jgi:hypothetical protein
MSSLQWKKNQLKHQIPAIYKKKARISATSGSVERLFSIAGNYRSAKTSIYHDQSGKLFAELGLIKINVVGLFFVCSLVSHCVLSLIISNCRSVLV